MTTDGLRIAPKFTLPLDAVTETFAILAKRGAGKSNAAVVMAEEMYDHQCPWVAIDPKGDWWGVRAAGDGKAAGLAVIVFGGLHGDVPLEPTAGKLVADLIVEKRLTCVLDVSEMTKADQRRFLIDFADRLYRTNREPLHVFCEEADEYIPQRVMGENAKLVGVFETLVKRGRFRGIGVTLVTQRSASLNKDVLTQVETLIPMRTPSPQDRKAILAWVDYHAAGAEAVAELPGLANGEAWVFSPQWLETLVKIKFRRRRTFDSGATPTVGGKPRPPATLAEVDLAALTEAMAATIEKAKADDPRELRAQILRLEQQVKAQDGRTYEQGYQDGESSMLADYVFALDDVWPDGADEPYPSVVAAHIKALRDKLGAVQALVSDAAAILAVEQMLPVEAKQGQPTTTRPAPLRGPTPHPRIPVDRTPAEPIRRPTGTAGDTTLGKAHKAILTVLALYGPLPKVKVAVRAGYAAGGGGFNNALSRLRSLGYVDKGDKGDPVTITDAGAAALGPVEPLPTGPDLVAHHARSLPKAAKEILAVLIDNYPNEMTKEDIAAATPTGYEPSGGGFNNGLSRLRSLDLVFTVDGYTMVVPELVA